MFGSGYFFLFLQGLIPAAVTAILFLAKPLYEKKIPYAVQQAIIGIIFGCIAIYTTENGVPVSGAQMNCRDASVLCAGLFFGGPAGIIAGLIGGIERWFAVYWGIGTFTRVACSVSTILAGFFAAAINRFFLKDRYPSWSLAFMIGAVMEAIHMGMCFVTNVNAIDKAADVVKLCTAPMVACNALGVMVAALLVTAIARHYVGPTKAEDTYLLVNLQKRLLICFIIAFFATTMLSSVVQTALAINETEDVITLAIEDTKTDIVNATLTDDPNAISYRHIGSTGFVVIADENNIVLSGPKSLLGESISGYDAQEVRTPGLSQPMYQTTIAGTDCYCQSQYIGSYTVAGFYPSTEAFAARDRFAAINTLIQILMLAIVFEVLHVLINRRVVRKLDEVNGNLKDITSGDMDVVVNVRSSREFVQLSDSINGTVGSLKDHIAAEAARIDADLATAKNIQTGILPSVFPPYPKRNEFEIYATMDTAREVGGDFYDFYWTGANEFVMTIADVSGKGIPAAMFMMRAKSLLYNNSHAYLPPVEILATTNNQLCVGNDAGMFVTAMMVFVNVERDYLHLVTAGHNPMAIYHAETGKFEFFRVRAGLVLGGMEGMKYIEYKDDLKRGDQIFLYTDGVTEATNINNELFGEERLMEILNSPEYLEMSCGDQCKYVKQKIDEFAGEAPQFDDITMISFKYFGKDEYSDILNSMPAMPPKE